MLKDNAKVWCAIVAIIFISVILLNKIPMIIYILKNNSTKLDENTQQVESTVQVSESNDKKSEESKQELEKSYKESQEKDLTLEKNKSNLGETSTKNEIAFATLEETSLLSTGLEVIGLAIAVWTGLNIVNLVSRNEVNEVKENLNKIREQSDKIREDLNEINKNKDELNEIINNIENKNKDEFLSELLKTDEDEMSRYYYKKFKDEKVSFSKLVAIEHLFNRIYEMHVSKNVNLEQMSREINELKLRIEEAKDYIDNISRKNKPILLENYFKFRQAEGLFYIGYEINNSEEKYNKYEKAVSLYLDTVKELAIEFPEYKPSLITNIDFWEKDVNKYYNNAELFAYFANTIGESYGNMALANPKSKEENIEDIAERAIFYGKLAVDCAKKHDINKEVYYKNLGCNYERLERIKTNNSVHNSIETLDNYRKAFELTINKPQLSKNQMWRYYFTYLTYLNKYIKYKLKLDLTLKSSIKKNLSVEDTSDIIERIDEMNKVSSVAVADDIRLTSNIAMYGFANSYISLLKETQKNNKRIDETFLENKDYYLEKLKWSIDTMKIMNIKDDYFEQLNILYDSLNEE